MQADPETALSPKLREQPLTDELPPLPTPSSVEASQPLDQTVVLAALHWVATDPPQATPLPHDRTNREPSVLVMDAASEPVTPTLIPAADANANADADADADADANTEAVFHSQPISMTHTVLTMEAPPRLASQPAALLTAPITPAPVPRDEPIEISIGAIHLRVEAPTAQTQVRSPAAPTTAPRAPAPTTPPRSALARRALRRI
ncbi:hypothetical protein [Pseudomonas akapageensis]|uniref:hypothetical protein n=1 Tax=Pseudomonas akapageensis TaxID=2609961 RepID=UPI00140A8A6B|nr:hypothetical protein [Pseudomonas akapageensis]